MILPEIIHQIKLAYREAEKNSPFIDNTKYDGAITMPPPNVTGKLHIGHALNLITQDVFVRFNYIFKNTKIRWIPGTDHAGIATQLLVKRKLEAEGIRDLSQEELVKEIWKWIDVYSKDIFNQLTELGLSLAWDSHKFTLDKDMQSSVIEAFCRLYDMNLIFKAKRMVNWDVDLQTVLSDIETVSKETDGTLWYLKYYKNDGEWIEVATTRPETLFADEAVAVHPEDPRYAGLEGIELTVPLINHKVKIVYDARCDLDKGSGAVKIDPAHGQLDFDLALTHNLPIIPIIDKAGLMCGQIPDWLNGLSIKEARKIVVQKLTEQDLISKKEAIKHMVPHGERSGSVLEPYVTEQWFFDMGKLSDKAKELVNNNTVQLIPERFKSIYNYYLDHIQPWCISRQIAWGHRIPAWHDKDNNIYVARSYAEACAKAGTDELRQDLDVLDTWFSSGLWPMNTLGWPDTIDPQYYPNLFLITGSDILFFWVTKMIMMHLALIPECSAPFKVVKLHGLVQDQCGLKMSKSKGNVLEPLELIEEYGRDALGFALMSAASDGNNLKFGQQNLDKAKKFLIKIWNAFNWCLEHSSNQTTDLTHPSNQWILEKINDLQNSFIASLNEWNVYETSNELYHFIWNDFAAWYLESAKVLLASPYAPETKYTIYLACTHLLKIMHSVLPFVTECFWAKFTGTFGLLQNCASLPELGIYSAKIIDQMHEIIEQLRSILSHFQYQKEAVLYLKGDIPKDYLDIMIKLTKHSIVLQEPETFDRYLHFKIDSLELYLDRTKIMVENIAELFTTICAEYAQHLNLLTEKLSDPGFLAHADPILVQEKEQRARRLRSELQVYENAAQQPKSG